MKIYYFFTTFFLQQMALISSPPVLKVALCAIGHTITHQTTFSGLEGLLVNFVGMGHSAGAASLMPWYLGATTEYIV